MPKATTPKKPKRLDPKQVFVAMSDTREGIADQMNAIMETEGWKGEKFTKDDPRLTDEVCQSFVDGTQSAFCDVDETHDHEYEYQKEDVRVLLGIPSDDEEGEEDDS